MMQIDGKGEARFPTSCIDVILVRYTDLIESPGSREMQCARCSIVIGFEAIASRLEAIASRLEAIATRLEAIATRLEAIASGGHR